MTLLLLCLASCGPPMPVDTDADTDATGDADTDADTDTDTPGGDPALLCQVELDCSGNILDEPKVPCSMSVTAGDGTVVYVGPAGVELRGRSSLTFPKPQYGLELRSYAELPIWPGFTWHYLHDGSDQGTAWRVLAFDDSLWARGAAPLGYGEDYLNTVIASEPAVTTTWLRYTFVPDALSEVRELKVGVIRNDGVAVYLNGTEILRDNLDPIAEYTTPATVALTEEEETWWVTADVDPTLLVEGANLLAVEVHQAVEVEGGAPRARFDLYLEAAGADEDAELFGMGHESHWILNGQYLDRALFRNRLAFDLFQSMGEDTRYATESLFCELTLDGAYAGVYTLGERIGRDGSRVDIDDDGSSFIIKLDDEEGFHANIVGNGTWQLVYPDASTAAEAEVGAWLTGWEAAILAGDSSSVFAHVDMASAVDFVLLNEFAKNIDAYQLSVHLWKDSSGPAYFSPWDLDLSFGYPYYDCGAEGWVARALYIDVMAADPTFHAALVARWSALRSEQLSEDAILARITAYDTTLGAAVARNFERWPIEAIAFETDDTDNWLCPVESYDAEHARVLSFISARLAWMDANIDTF